MSPTCCLYPRLLTIYLLSGYFDNVQNVIGATLLGSSSGSRPFRGCWDSKPKLAPHMPKQRARLEFT